MAVPPSPNFATVADAWVKSRPEKRLPHFQKIRIHPPSHRLKVGAARFQQLGNRNLHRLANTHPKVRESDLVKPRVRGLRLGKAIGNIDGG